MNPAKSSKTPPLMQAISNNFANRLRISNFKFHTDNRAKIVSKLNYRNLRLVRGARMYIEYYYRVPADLPAQLCKPEWAGKEWARFRILQDINRQAKKDPTYPDALLESTRIALQDGFSPFKYLLDEWQALKAEEVAAQTKVLDITLAGALDLFLKEYEHSATSKEIYRVMVNLIEKYFVRLDRYYAPLKEVTKADIKALLLYYRTEKKWSPTTYNNKVANLTKIFTWFKEEKELIADSPMDKIEKTTKGTKGRHKYYDDKTIPKIKKAMRDIGPRGEDLLNFCEVIYYTCTRPDQETRQLKCENVLFDRELLYIPHEIAKGGNGGYVPMGKDLMDLFRKIGVDTAPGDYYIFGVDGRPGPVPTADAYYSNLFRKEVRDPNGFDSKYTNYAWKHTRVIHLYTKEKRGIFDIQALCRHKSASMTEEYLGELGCIITEAK
jgi:integrase